MLKMNVFCTQFGIFYTVGVVVYHSAAADFGNGRHIKSGAPLILVQFTPKLLAKFEGYRPAQD